MESKSNSPTKSKTIFFLIFAVSICLIFLSNCKQIDKKSTDTDEIQTDEQDVPVASQKLEDQKIDHKEIQVDEQIKDEPEEETVEEAMTKTDSKTNKQKTEEIREKTKDEDTPDSDTQTNKDTNKEPDKQTDTKTNDQEKEVVEDDAKEQDDENKTENKVPADENNWPVPGKYKNMQNPFKADAESIGIGKTLFSKYCKSCHGSKGLGDGSKATYLNTNIRSFKSVAFKAQKPGEIYYKSFIGRNEMPNFEKKIPDDEDRWAIINYLMTF